MKIFPWLAPTLIPVNWAFSWHPAVLFDVHLVYLYRRTFYSAPNIPSDGGLSLSSLAKFKLL